MSDQDRISPYNNNTISSRQVTKKIKTNINLPLYKLIQYQILKTNITRTEWQIVRRLASEILGVNGQ